MERTTTVVLLLLTTLFLHFSGAKPTKSSRQILPAIPGYIPVYIQDGEVPPDVESIYDVSSSLLDHPAGREVDAINQEVQAGDTNVKESEASIVSQLTDNVRRENELEVSPAEGQNVEESPLTQEADDSVGNPGQVIEIPSRNGVTVNQP